MSQHIFQPQGEYTAIDNKLALDAIKSLSSSAQPEEQQATIDAVRNAPQKYAPPVFYVMSQALFAQGHCDDAAFWFYAGQLRARYDATRCADATASAAVSALNERCGPVINQYMFQRVDQLKELIPKVVEFDARTPHEYDHRWINLHGMGAFTNQGGALSLPEDQWPQLEQQTRDNYVSGFNEMLKMVAQP